MGCVACDFRFKRYIIDKHRNFHQNKKPIYVKGRKLNYFYGISLEKDTSYRVCSYIFEKLKNHHVQQKRRTISNNNTPVIPTRFSARLLKIL